MGEAKFCPECGTQRKPGARFCAGCGYGFDADQAASAPPVAAPPPAQPAAPAAVPVATPPTAPAPAPVAAPPQPVPAQPVVAQAVAPAATTTAAPTIPGPPAEMERLTVGNASVPLPPGVGPRTLIGGALILLGSFLPWYTVFNISVSSWDIPAWFVVTGSQSATGLKIGLLLLSAAALALPYATKQVLPNWVPLVIAIIAINAGGLSIVRGMADETGAGLGFGLFVTLAGGLLVGYEWIMAQQAAKQA